MNVVTCKDGHKVGRTPFNVHISDAQLCGEEFPAVAPKDDLPDGFEVIFGPRPKPSDFTGYRRNRKWRAGVVTWENAKRTFKGLGMPEGPNAQTINDANASAEFFEMGVPAYYENNYGFQVRFPDSQDSSFQTTFEAFTGAAHGHVIVSYQWGLTVDGIPIDANKIHPFAPPRLKLAQLDLQDDE